MLTLTDRLRAERYEVDSVSEGEVALASLGRVSYDLVLLDLMLRGIDGYEVCRQLRAQGLTVPVLMLTARAQVVDRVVGLKLGADDYLVKPFDMTELLARVEALLRRGRSVGGGREGTYAFGDVRVDFRRAGSCARAARSRCPAWSSSCSPTSSSTAARCSAATSCSTRSGGYDALPRAAPWTCTWGRCARKLESVPAHPGSSSRCIARATASRAELWSAPLPCSPGFSEGDVRTAVPGR